MNDYLQEKQSIFFYDALNITDFSIGGICFLGAIFVSLIIISILLCVTK